MSPPTHTDAPRRFRFLGRAAMISVAKSLSSGAQVLVAVALVRLLSEQEWASMALFLSFYVTALAIGSLNIHQSVLFFYGRMARADRRQIVAQTTGLAAAAGLLTAAAVLALHPLLGDGRFQLDTLLLWLAVIVVIEIPTIGGGQVLLAAERPALAAGFDASMAVLQATGLSLPVILGYGLDGAMRGLLAYALVRLVLYCVLVAAVVPPGRIRVDWKLIKKQIVYTAPLGLTIATAILNRNVDKWLVAALDPVHFGVYAIAAQEVPVASVIPYAVSAVFATRMVHAFKQGQLGRARDYWLAQTSRSSLLVVPITIGLILCAREMVILLVTEDYALATLPFQVYSVVLLHRVAEYGLVMRAAGETRTLWWASFLLLGSNLLFSAPLTAWLGMVGAAIGTLGAVIVSWVYFVRRIAGALDTPMRHAFPYGLYARVLLLSVATAALTAQAADALDLGIAARLAVKAALYSGLCWALVRGLGLSARVHPVPDDDEDFHADLGT